MEFENEQKHEEQAAEQQQKNSQEGSSYQGYRPGRSPRPRIHQPRPYSNQGGYNRHQNQEENQTYFDGVPFNLLCANRNSFVHCSIPPRRIRGSRKR